MKTVTNLLSGILIVFHYPADLGGFMFFYLMLRQFAPLELIPRLGAALILGAVTALISSVFHSLWASDQSARYLLYSRKTAQGLDVLSFALTVVPILLIILTSINLRSAMTINYLMILAVVFVARMIGMVALPICVAELKASEAIPCKAEPKVTLAAIMESMNPPVRAPVRKPVTGSSSSSPNGFAPASAA